MKSLYGVGRVPCDTYLQEMADPIETRYFRTFFTRLFAFVQRSGLLRQFEYFEEGYLAPMDGTGQEGSTASDAGTHHSADECLKE